MIIKNLNGVEIPKFSLLFVSGKGFFRNILGLRGSNRVKVNKKSHVVTHVALMYTPGFVVDSHKDKYGCGVTRRPLEKYIKSDEYDAWWIYRWRNDMKEDDTEMINDYIKDSVVNGIQYDVPQLLGNAVISFLPFLKSYKNTLGKPNKYTCIEFVRRAYSHSGFQILPSFEIETATPAQLMRSPRLQFLTSNLKGIPT